VFFIFIFCHLDNEALDSPSLITRTLKSTPALQPYV